MGAFDKGVYSSVAQEHGAIQARERPGRPGVTYPVRLSLGAPTRG